MWKENFSFCFFLNEELQQCEIHVVSLAPGWDSFILMPCSVFGMFRLKKMVYKFCLNFCFMQ